MRKLAGFYILLFVLCMCADEIDCSFWLLRNIIIIFYLIKNSILVYIFRYFNPKPKKFQDKIESESLNRIKLAFMLFTATQITRYIWASKTEPNQFSKCLKTSHYMLSSKKKRFIYPIRQKGADSFRQDQTIIHTRVQEEEDKLRKPNLLSM